MLKPMNPLVRLLLLSLLINLAFAMRVWGQDAPSSGANASDEYALAKESDIRYRLDYHNAAPGGIYKQGTHMAGVSKAGRFEVSLDGVTVRFTVEIGTEKVQHAEIIEVDVDDPWLAVPPVIHILDGEVGSVLIVPKVEMMY